jgi:potassium voltage-gated channel Eag-related subfamily H protein 8
VPALSPLLHSQKPVSTHLNKFELVLQFITKQNYFFLISKATFGTHSTLDHFANLEHVQNTFLMHKHLVTVFFGLEKAYDMAWQFGILRTLHGWIVGGQLPLTITNFLQDPYFCVHLGDVCSLCFVQENGVLQGLILSVTLFSVAINGVTNANNQSISTSLYVDDIAIYYSSRPC